MDIFIICILSAVITIYGIIVGAYIEHKWMIKNGYRKSGGIIAKAWLYHITHKDSEGDYNNFIKAMEE